MRRCLDCNRPICSDRRTVGRCRSCSKRGNLHPNFKNGLNTLERQWKGCFDEAHRALNKPRICIDCGVQTSGRSRGTGLCVRCSRKGARNPSYKTGQFLRDIKKFCQACGKAMHRASRKGFCARCKRLRMVFPVKDTKIELKLQECLAKKGIQFLTHTPLENICQSDIQLCDQKVVIFADGCYWHGCPIHYPTRQEKRRRDNQVDSILRNAGWKVFRFWEHDIKVNPDRCIEQVLSYIPKQEGITVIHVGGVN